MVTFKNPKDRLEDLIVSEHAFERFITRYKRLYKIAESDDLFNKENLARINDVCFLLDIFQRSSKIHKTSFSKKQKKRDKQHGSNCRRYRYGPFDFITVKENGTRTIVTVEITGMDPRKN